MPGEGFMLGCDSNYYLEMAGRAVRWTAGGEPVDPLRLFAERGGNAIRVRVLDRYDGPSGIAYAGETALRAQRAGLAPYVNLFLSERWATANHQPLPAAWRGLSFEERTTAARRTARLAVTHLLSLGVDTHLYQVGNEVEYGLCGSFTADVRREDVDWMRDHGSWREIVVLLAAAMEGVRQADPEARFLVHIAHWFNAPFAIGFFESCRRAGLSFDLLGASYYPTSAIPRFHFGTGNALAELDRFVGEVTDALGLPMVFAEYGYPSSESFPGEFSTWTDAVPGFPLTPGGQRAWIESFLAWARRHPAVAGAFYWSPEFYLHPNWRAFALFDAEGEARPALGAFG